MDWSIVLLVPVIGDDYFIHLTKCVLQLRYNYYLSYEEAEQRLGVERPSQQLARNRLRWIGHALRSDDIVLQEVLTFVPRAVHAGTGDRGCGSTTPSRLTWHIGTLSYQHAVKTT